VWGFWFDPRSVNAQEFDWFRVPALSLVDGDETIFESSAIALFLTDKYRNKILGPAVGDPKRGEYLSWLAYRPGVMEPALISRRFDVKHVYGAMGWAPADEVEEVLNKHLAPRKYFLGDDFTSLDILVGGGVHFLLMAKMLKDTPVMRAYSQRVVDRPAFRKMMEMDKK